MKRFKNIQGKSINLFIYFLVVLIGLNGILDLYNKKAYKSHEIIINEVKSSQVKMEMVLRTLQNADLGLRGFYIIPNDQLLHPYLQAKDSLPVYIDEMQLFLTSRNISTINILPLEHTFNDYFALVGQMVEWRRQGNLAAIDSVVASDPGYVVWKQWDELNRSIKKEGNSIIAESKAKTDKIMATSVTLRVLLVVLGLPTLIIILLRLNKERKRRKKHFQELESNNRKYLFDSGEREDVSVNENSLIFSLIENLKKATGFIADISKGNFNISWEGLNEKNIELNKNNLVGELLQMREQMIKVKEEDMKRVWTSEGISRFSELVRRYQDDIQMLSDRLTSEVVKYLGASQASLFFVSGKNDQDAELVLSGCYAYNRKKFLEKKVSPGEGLIGQVFLEKELLVLTEIPQNYIKITSGLGEATPGCLVVVPLMFNDKVEGILEIASFKNFRPHETEFLSKIGEIIASSIINIRSSSEMRILMQNLQEQSEMMKAQEEEMRQNMEELQATQEEMSRKATEYQSVITAGEIALKEKEEEIMQLKNMIKVV